MMMCTKKCKWKTRIFFKPLFFKKKHKKKSNMSKKECSSSSSNKRKAEAMTASSSSPETAKQPKTLFEQVSGKSKQEIKDRLRREEQRITKWETRITQASAKGKSFIEIFGELPAYGQLHFSEQGFDVQRHVEAPPDDCDTCAPFKCTHDDPDIITWTISWD